MSTVYNSVYISLNTMPQSRWCYILLSQSYILRRRQQPAKTSTNVAQKCKPFNNNLVKEMDIPKFIDQYNLYICSVDVVDQLRSYYMT